MPFKLFGLALPINNPLNRVVKRYHALRLWKAASLNALDVRLLQEKLDNYEDGIIPTIPYRSKRTLTLSQPIEPEKVTLA
jgi:hypothetical protein